MPCNLCNRALLCALTAALAAAGCVTPSTGDRAAEDHTRRAEAAGRIVGAPSLADQAGADVRGGKLDTDRRAAEQAAQIVLRRSPRSFIASTSVPMANPEGLPTVFSDPLKLNFEDRPSIRTVAERLTGVSGVPIRVKGDVFSDVSAAPQRVVTPTGATPSQAPLAVRETSVATVPMKWTGSLEGYLNYICDLTGLSWEYRDGAVIIERYMTEFFELATFDGDTTYSMGMTGADAGTTGSSSSTSGSASTTTTNSSAMADVSDKGKFNPIESVIRMLKQIVKDTPGSDVVRAEGSGRVAVTTTRETMGKVRSAVRAENEALLRQVQIQFDVYAVRHLENDQQGVDWSGVFQSISKAFGVTFTTPATLVSSSVGNVTFSILDPTVAAPGNTTARRWGNSKVMLDLLSEFGNTAQHWPVSLISQNRQWARKASLNSKAYVSATTPGVATSLGAGAPGLTTSSITTGDRYIAQPYIMDNGTVLLKFGIGLSSLLGIQNFTSGSGVNQQTVQIPETTSVIDQAVVSLKAGQVLVITGMSRYVTSDNKRTLAEGAPVAFGGSKTASRERDDFVVFVRPSLL